MVEMETPQTLFEHAHAMHHKKGTRVHTRVLTRWQQQWRLGDTRFSTRDTPCWWQLHDRCWAVLCERLHSAAAKPP